MYNFFVLCRINKTLKKWHLISIINSLDLFLSKRILIQFPVLDFYNPDG